MEKCKRCFSYAINHHRHGRDGSGLQLCDVCFWRNRAELATATLKKIRFTAVDADIRQLAEEAVNFFDNVQGHPCRAADGIQIDGLSASDAPSCSGLPD